MRNLARYLRIWIFFVKTEFQLQLTTKLSAILFMLGKFFRFITFFFLLIVLRNNTETLVGYSMDAIIVFFLTFNIIDLLSQVLFRGVYMFSGKVRSGEFDYFLAKPLNPLFRALGSNPDINDVLMFILLSGFFVWFIVQGSVLIAPVQILFYLVLLINGMLISTAFHIIVLCVGIVTAEVDNAIMMYRDISQMGRFPIAIYREPFRWIATFVVPVGVMMSFPAQVLLGAQPIEFFVIAFAVGVTSITLALFAWKYALRKYTSASS